jgi:hypothetical protein
VYLEIADVRDYARIRVNGAVFEAKAWQPYRWDITNSLQAGNNDVQINVFATPSGRGPGGPPPGAAPGAAGTAGGRGGRGGRGGQGAPGAAGMPAGAPPAGMGGGRGTPTPPASGLLGPVRLVAR